MNNIHVHGSHDLREWRVKKAELGSGEGAFRVFLRASRQTQTTCFLCCGTIKKLSNSRANEFNSRLLQFLIVGLFEGYSVRMEFTYLSCHPAGGYLPSRIAKLYHGARTCYFKQKFSL